MHNRFRCPIPFYIGQCKRAGRRRRRQLNCFCPAVSYVSRSNDMHKLGWSQATLLNFAILIFLQRPDAHSRLLHSLSSALSRFFLCFVSWSSDRRTHTRTHQLLCLLVRLHNTPYMQAGTNLSPAFSLRTRQLCFESSSRPLFLLPDAHARNFLSLLCARIMTQSHSYWMPLERKS